MLHILDLPTELLIQIFLDLDVSDFGSCLLACRRLKVIIQDSCLLQYRIRTALAGVLDPLLQPNPSLEHRLESLKRWSDAWLHPGTYLRCPAHVLTHTPKNRTDFVLCDDYLIIRDFGGRHGYRHVAGYEWLDLREPSDGGWTRILFEEKVVPFAFMLDADQKDLLAVLLGCTESATFQLRLLGFRDGSPHPLALRPSIDIALPTKETHYIGLEMHMSIMGSYIVIAAGLPPERTGIDLLLLVDWQMGLVTTLCSTQTRTYLTDFVVLSDNVIALIRSSENTIELCRIDTTSTASLQSIRVLKLPPLLSYARLSSASVKTENNLSAFATHRRPEWRHRPRYPFSPSPTDALVLLTLTAKIKGSAFVDTRTYTLAVHTRTLLSYGSSSHVSSHPLVVPWDAWGPLATRCFDGNGGASDSVVAGQRWFKNGAIRDFCPHRVRAAADGLGLRSSTLAAGRMFACDIESALPYSEISVVKDDGTFTDEAMIDKERVVFLSGHNDDRLTIHVHMMG